MPDQVQSVSGCMLLAFASGLWRMMEYATTSKLEGTIFVDEIGIMSNFSPDSTNDEALESLTRIAPTCAFPLSATRDHHGNIEVMTGGIPLAPEGQNWPGVKARAYDLMLLEAFIESLGIADEIPEPWWITRKSQMTSYAGVTMLRARLPIEAGLKLAIAAGISLNEEGIPGAMAISRDLLAEANVALRHMSSWKAADMCQDMDEILPMFQPGAPSGEDSGLEPPT